VKALRAPFPWFGGKSRAAHLVWAAFGDVANYVEPFFGSGAVLLSRPTEPRIETVNDLDAYLSNFWRAVHAAPEDVAAWADWPVNEVDLHARHRWLVNGEGAAEFREAMKHDPDLYDAKRAGWWVWGICQWIGSGWCSAPEWKGRTNAGRRARGLHTADHEQRPDLTASRGMLSVENGKRPHLWRGGMGVHAKRERDLAGAANWEKRPVLAHGNRGVHQVREQVPHISGDAGAAGSGIHASGKMPKSDRGSLSRLQGSRQVIVEWMLALADRLRRVRVCCGDWNRVLGASSTEKIGVTGVFLDPPYGADAGRDPSLYTHDDLAVAAAVREWALEQSGNRRLRIALCGYEGEHIMPDSWQCVAWKAPGGYAASAGNTENAARERIWFSPSCEPVLKRQPSLFEVGT
jgi:hypothetical protein